MKRCWACGEEKPLEAFYKDSRSKDGKQGQCSDCAKARLAKYYVENREPRRAYSRRYRQENLDEVRARQRARHFVYSYGITQEQRDAWIERLEGKCEVCQRELPLVVDHDHDSGEVRGMLCSPCNTALGLLGEDPERIRLLGDYLAERAVTAAQAAS